jgi:hypothetical protein
VNTRQHLEKMKGILSKIPPTSSAHELWKQRREVLVAEKMVELCQADGEIREHILNGEDFSVMDVENRLVGVAREIAGDSAMHHGIATELGRTFSTTQQRLLAYLMWRPFLTRNKRHRWKMASRLQILEMNRNRVPGESDRD